MKIYIATPMYGGNCKSSYTLSIVSLATALRGRGHDVVLDVLTNESLITRARNTLVKNFLNTDYETLLFIDADHGFEADSVIKMLEADKDIIGGIYPMKAINWPSVIDAANAGETDYSAYSGYFAVNILPGKDTYDLAEPMEVIDVGTGMMAIKRKVFEDLAPTCDKYGGHGNDGVIKRDEENMVTEFFKTEIVDGILLSEDYYLCKEWRKLGNSVYAAPWVQITHAGDYSFSGSFAKAMLRLSKKDTNSTEAK